MLMLALLVLAILLSDSSSLILRQAPIGLLILLVGYTYVSLTVANRKRRDIFREQLKDLRSKDHLTGLANRQLFLSSLHLPPKPATAPATWRQASPLPVRKSTCTCSAQTV